MKYLKEFLFGLMWLILIQINALHSQTSAMQDSIAKVTWNNVITNNCWVITGGKITRETGETKIIEPDGKWFIFYNNSMINGEDNRIRKVEDFTVEFISQREFKIKTEKNEILNWTIKLNETGMFSANYEEIVQQDIIECIGIEKGNSFQLILEKYGDRKNAIPIEPNWTGVYTSKYSLTDNKNASFQESLPQTIQIGSQTWQVSDLKMKFYRNGDPIKQINSDEEWKKFSKSKLGCFRILPNGTFVYNYYALSDNRGLIPDGYKLPNKQDFEELLNFSKKIEHLIGYTYNEVIFNESTMSESTKKIIGTNQSGFNATKGGFCYAEGNFTTGDCSYYWTETAPEVEMIDSENVTDENTSVSEIKLKIGCVFGYCSQDIGELYSIIDEGYGLSIRLLKN